MELLLVCVLLRDLHLPCRSQMGLCLDRGGGVCCVGMVGEGISGLIGVGVDCGEAGIGLCDGWSYVCATCHSASTWVVHGVWVYVECV